MHAGDCSRLPSSVAAAGQRVGEDRAVDAAVQHREEHVPIGVGYEPVHCGDDAIEQRADRLAAEKTRVLGNDVPPRFEEGGLELVLGDLVEAAGFDLAQIGPRLGLERRARRCGRFRPSAAGRS